MKFTGLTTLEFMDTIEALSSVAICANDPNIKRAAIDERERVKDICKGKRAPLDITPTYYDPDVMSVYAMIDRYGF